MIPHFHLLGLIAVFGAMLIRYATVDVNERYAQVGNSGAFISQGQLQSGGLPFRQVQHITGHANNPATTVTAVFSTGPQIGNALIVAVSIGGNSAGGNPTFAITDNSTGGPNTWTSQKYQSGASNGLASQIFSAPVTSSITPNFTVTITETGGVTAWGMVIDMYELVGLSSTTTTGANGHSGGSFFSVSDSGNFIISTVTYNISAGSPVTAFSGTTLDISDQTSLIGGIGTGNGTWSQSGGTVSFVIGADAGFN